MERLISVIESISLALHKTVIIVFLPAMGVLITIDVILRYAFDAPFIWGTEANGLLLLIVFFGSLTYCWVSKRHIRMELIYGRFKGKLRVWADIFAASTAMLFFGMLGIQALREVPHMLKINETGEMFLIPLWPFKVYMGLCSVLFFLLLLFSNIDAFLKMYRKEDK